MAPLFLDGKVIIGASGGEYQRRGHVRAYDAATGKMLWEFFTVPGAGDPGNDTWANESWRTGGDTVWTTPAADSQLGLIYITTGNAAPDENGSERAGMNLFTSSIVALDVNTAQRRWHFQEVHHDIWDYDGPQPAHLFTLERNGQQIPAIGHANKNGSTIFSIAGMESRFTMSPKNRCRPSRPDGTPGQRNPCPARNDSRA